MARAKHSVNVKRKRHTVLGQASGYHDQRLHVYHKAKEQVTRSFIYSYCDRKAKKGDFRRLWIRRINATSHVWSLTYNRLIQGPNLASVKVDYYVLAGLAVDGVNAFNALTEVAKDIPPADISAPETRQVGSSAGRLTVLDNSHADHARRASGLVGHSARSRPGLMLAEGPQVMHEPATYRLDTVRDVYVREDTWEMHADVVDVARHATHWVYPVTVKVSAVLSGDSQDIHAVASLDVLSRESPEPSVGETTVTFAQGHDPSNTDTIIRAAGAFGAAGVVAVADTVDTASPKVMRPSTGSVFHVPVCVVPSLADTRALIHSRSAALLDTNDGAASINLSDLLVQRVSARLRPSQSYAWVFSNEAHDLSGNEMRLYDRLVSIPVTGDAESLNMANAAAACPFAPQTMRSVEN